MNPMRQQIGSLLSVEAREGGFVARFNVDPKLAVFPDHFRDFQLVPGICLMQAVVIASARATGADDFRVRSMKSAKMTQPVLPGDQIVIHGEMAANGEGNYLIKARLTRGDQRCAEFVLLAGAAEIGAGAPR
jgi:3-hydroxymyristoyl/3-hydroxydecanoyl-(acyl carrier protein) dehydratase